MTERLARFFVHHDLLVSLARQIDERDVEFPRWAGFSRRDAVAGQKCGEENKLAEPKESSLRYRSKKSE